MEDGGFGALILGFVLSQIAIIVAHFFPIGKTGGR